MSLHPKALPNFVVTALGGIYLLAMHVILPNNGGSGADLPESLLVWSLMLMMTAIGFLFFLRKPIYLSSTLKCIILAASLMTLPLAWSSHRDWIFDSLAQFGGLWAGVLLYAMLINCRFGDVQIKWLLYMIALAAVIQALYGLAGLSYPALLPDFEQRVLQVVPTNVGVFQQRNVTASFLAVGGGSLLFILGSSFFICRSRQRELMRKAVVFSGIVIIYYTLTDLQSRIGWLSGCCVFMGMLLLYGRKETPLATRFLLLLAPVTGVTWCVLVMNGTLLEALHQHDGSNLQRLMILHETWRMILLHPLKGWGYGSYIWSFSHFIADRAQPIDNGASVVSYPHNEFLYWWIEGGMVALSGLLVVCFAGMRLLFRSTEKNKLAFFICLLPLLLHTQVEYPFYQSAIHWLSFILLLSLIDRQDDDKDAAAGGAMSLNISTIYLSAFLLFMAMIVIISLRNELILTRFESQPDDFYHEVLSLPETGVGTERLRRLNAEALIIDYKHNNDVRALRQFSAVASRWLKTWGDADMYDNLIEVNYFLGNKQTGDSLKREASRLFMQDDRFKH